MSNEVQVTLKKSTHNALSTFAKGFGVNEDEVIQNLIERVRTLENKDGQKNLSADATDIYQYEGYDILKLPKGRIVVTKNDKKVSNMKDILIKAALDANVPKQECDRDLTTYQIGRNLFRYTK
ncbi:hypothetical protein ACT3T8_18230 [Halomonas sp. AOP1-B1-8]|uniref:hypothetical protein n=1 Tax=Halomonas sp. AOP1-B1-8 TaxID=3457726 RepID=UPI004033E750